MFTDVNDDGFDDFLVTTPMVVKDETGTRRTRYQRFFRETKWGFEEDLSKARETSAFGE